MQYCCDRFLTGTPTGWCCSVIAGRVLDSAQPLLGVLLGGAFRRRRLNRSPDTEPIPPTSLETASRSDWKRVSFPPICLRRLESRPLSVAPSPQRKTRLEAHPL